MSDKGSNAKKRKKVHRNQNTQIRRINESNSAKAPRMFNIVDFAAHHLEELKHLEKVLISNQAIPDGRPILLPRKGRGYIDTKGRRQFQTLPRHLRRRSASHNLYRIPLRLRARAKMEVEKSGGNSKSGEIAATTKKPHRKHKRRPKFLRQDYLRRQKSTGIRWLETHIWSRKRMHLEQHWGFYLPMRRNDKGIRAGYKNASYVVTLHDASYHETLMISAESSGDLLSLLEIICPRLLISKCSNTTREYVSEVFTVGKFPRGCIGPVRFVWMDLERKNIMMWIHPSIYDTIQKEVEQAIQDRKITVLARKGDFLRYRLTGPRSHAILQSVLHISKEEDQKSEGTKLWEATNGIRSCAELPKRALLSLSVDDPESHFPPLPAKKALFHQKPKSYHQITEMYKHVAAWSSQDVSSSLWSFVYDPMVQKKSIPILLIQRPGGDATYSFALDCVDQRNKEIASGWDLIVPRHFGMNFWKSLVYSGARVVGMHSEKALELERGTLSFPLDFVDTKAYKERSNGLLAIQKEKYEKKPASKRVNFMKINSAYPWTLHWQSLVQHWFSWSSATTGSATYLKIISEKNQNFLKEQMDEGVEEAGWFVIRERNKKIADWLYSDNFSDIPLDVLRYGLVTVRVLMDVRGTPKDGAFICFPTLKDFQEIIQKAPTKGPVSLDMERNRTRISSTPKTDIPFSFSTSRDVMGFVSSGGHAYSSGKGTAIATCSFFALLILRIFSDVCDEDFGRILVRNLSSKNYLPASICLPADTQFE